MVDSIRIRSRTTESNLQLEKWTTIINKTTGEYYYRASIKHIWMAFYPNSKNVIISGKYIKLHTQSKYKNYDEIFKTRDEIFEFFFTLENYINSYFIIPAVNILEDKVTRIDFCMNIEVKNVKEYLEFFNRYYNQKPKRLTAYASHVKEQELPIDSSFYIKTDKQYKGKKNQNFTLNIYSKANELENKRKEQISKFGKSSITDEDIIESENILRIEVQLHYAKLKSVCEKFKINPKTCCLYELFDIEIARSVLKNELKRFFTDADFYSYEQAKKEILLKIKNHKSKKAALEYIKAVAKNNKVDSTTIQKKLIDIGIFPYCFIPKDWNIDILPSPIKLVDEKIQNNQLQWLSLKKGGNTYDENSEAESKKV